MVGQLGALVDLTKDAMPSEVHLHCYYCIAGTSLDVEVSDGRSVQFKGTSHCWINTGPASQAMGHN